MDIAFIQKLRRSVASVTVLALLSTFVGVGTAFADWPFTDDEPSDADMAASLTEAYEEGWLTGYSDTGESGWEDSLQRDQAAKIAVVAFLGEDEVIEATEDPFTDVVVGEAWSADYVHTAVEYGYVQGYSDSEGNLTGYYGPGDYLNYAQWATILMRAMGVSADTTEDAGSFPSTDEDSYWASPYQTLYAYGNDWVMDAEPGEEITRGEVSEWTNQAQEPEYRWEDGDDDDDDDDDSSDATLTVELSDDTAEAATIADKATSVEVVTWDFTAEGGDVELDGLTVHQYGVSDMASDSEVYLYMGSERLTTAKTINSSTDLATFNNVDVEIEEGETVSITLRLNVGNRTTTGEAGFELEDVSAVDAGDAEVSGDFPVQGAKHSLSTTEVGTMTVEKNGTISNPTVGEDEAVIAKFKLTAGTNAAAVQELGLYLSGSIDTDDVQNFKLYATGVSDPVAEAEAVNGEDLIPFVLDGEYTEDADDEECEDDWGWCISDGSSKTFYVEADLNTGRSADTLKVYVDEAADVVAVDARRGFGMQVDLDNTSGYDGTSCTSTSGKCSYSALDGGEVTFSMENISNRTLVVDQDDVSLMNFTVTAESAVTFKDFVIALNASEDAGDDDAGLIDSSSNANFTDIRVKATDGSFTWGPVDADVFTTGSVGGSAIGTTTDQGANKFHQFTDDFEMEAGDSLDFQILVDVANQSALADETLTASVYIDSSYPELRDENNTTLTNSSSLVPTSTMAGDQFTIEASSLTVGSDSSVNDDTVVIGTDAAEFAAFSFGAGAAEDLTITDITFTGYVYNDTDAAFDAGFDDDDSDGTQESGEYSFSEIVLDLDLYEGSVAEENKINSTSASANGTTGAIEFEDLDWTIEADETKVMIVTGEIANNSTYNGSDVRVDIAAMSNITTVDSDGDSITSSSSATPNGGTGALSTGTEITVSSGGTLAVDIPTQVSLVPASQIVVAGTDDNLFTTLRFTAANESFEIDELALRNDYTSSVGDYDNNIEQITLQYYTDEEQTVSEEKTCSSSSSFNGVFVCRGLDIMVPDPDITGAPNYANVRVYVDISGTSDIGAAEKPALTLSLSDDFDAYGVDSSTRIQKTNLTITDLTAQTDADTTVDLSTTISSASTTSVVGDATFASNVVPGDFICIDVDDSATDCSALEAMYVTAVSTTTLTVVRGVNGTTATTYTADSGDDSILVYGSTDTTLDTMSTSYMQVQKADLSMEADAATVSGKSTSASDTIMTINVTVTGDEDVSIRQGKHLSDGTEGTDGGGNNTFADNTSVSIDGTSELLTAGASVANNDSFYFTDGTSLTSYPYVSFWMRAVDQAADQATDTVDFAQMTIFTAADATAAGDNSATLSNPVTTPLNDTWYFFPQVSVPGYGGAIVDADVNLGFEIDAIASFTNDTGGWEATDLLYTDRVILYQDQINVDLTSNADWASLSNTLAYLKQDGTTVATGYVDVDGALTSGTGQIHFVPVGTYGEIQISGSSELTVVMDTATNVTDAAANTESLTATVDMGNVSGAGDVLWYDQATSLNFFGVNSDDRVQVTNSY